MNIRKSLLWCVAVVVMGCLAAAPRASASVNVTVSPLNPVSLVGSNVTFTAQVSATGGETITGYTWKYSTNNQPPFLAIAGATNSTYTISNIQLTNAAYYFVSVTYNSGATSNLTAVSAVSQLTVHDQARVTVQPQPLTRNTGQSATFSVTAAGALPITYQWRYNTTNLANGGRFSGATSNTLTITGLLTNDSGNYDVVVNNAFGSATSQAAVLTVYAPPTISVAPMSQTVIVSNSAVFTLIPGGSAPFNYQWKKNGQALFDGGRISGSTSNVLTITGALTNDNGNYSVTFSNPAGVTNTVPVSLTVLIPPVITSPVGATGQQGFTFSYTVTATGTTPIVYSVDALPTGLTIDSNSGLITGLPPVSGVFNVILFASNAAAVAATNLQITLVSDVPGITSPLATNAQQGQLFTYIIMASNNPTGFTATGLPPGITFNQTNGTLSGSPLYTGTSVVMIGASNQFGADVQALTINIASDVPVITSPLTVRGTENNTNFLYVITASNAPTSFNAVGLPLGLVLDPTTGIISGSPAAGGTNNVTVYASNAYGTGSNTVAFRIAYAPLNGVQITSVTASYSSPYLLDFTFALSDPITSNAIVRPPESLSVLCMEGDLTQQIGVPIPSETAFIVGGVVTGSTSLKTLKTVFALDYSYSMFVTPGAITQMQSSVEGLIAAEPGTAQFSVQEFSADYVPPIQVIGFTSDRTRLNNAINGIQTNFVKGNIGGTRFYDAVAAALTNFTSVNPGEEDFIIVMSDGNDDSSTLVPPAGMSSVDYLVNLATNANVRIYCVGFGPNPNTNVLQAIATQTGGNYYTAATAQAIPSQFSLLLKDINSFYTLRWATLQRSAQAFQPMFQITIGNASGSFNTDFSSSVVPLYNPTNYAGNVQAGILQLLPDATTNISTVTLHAFYVPRFVRELKLHYRANYPCTVSMLSSTYTNDILFGWSMTQSNDATGGQFVTLTSPNLTNALTSLPYGISGDLLSFQFPYLSVPNSTNAFAFFTVDNTIYSNLPPSGQTFAITNTNAFVTNLPPAPPHGTPIPWLISFGFTNNFTNAELGDPNHNGLPTWQDYIAGLNPTNTNAASKFLLPPMQLPQPGQPPTITFNSVSGRIYEIDSSVDLINWYPLYTGITGTGSAISLPDSRNLSGVNSSFYRVSVTYH